MNNKKKKYLDEIPPHLINKNGKIDVTDLEDWYLKEYGKDYISTVNPTVQGAKDSKITNVKVDGKDNIGVGLDPVEVVAYNLTPQQRADMSKFKTPKAQANYAKEMDYYNKTGNSLYQKEFNKVFIPIVNGIAGMAAGGAMASAPRIIPIVADALGAGFTAQDIEEGNYKQAAIDAGLTLASAFGAPYFIRGGKYLSKELAPYIMAATMNKGINKATKYGDIRVDYSKLRDSESWFRITETPEINTIREKGVTYTTDDLATWKELYEKTLPNSVKYRNYILEKNYKEKAKQNNSLRRFNLMNTGRSHGNKIQASSGKVWEGGIAPSRYFTRIILEGKLPNEIPASLAYKNGKKVDLSRTDFDIWDSDEVPIGTRIGFDSHEEGLPEEIIDITDKTLSKYINDNTKTKRIPMPIESLSYYQHIPNAKGNLNYRYMGNVIPNKTKFDFNPDIQKQLQGKTSSIQNAFSSELRQKYINSTLLDNIDNPFLPYDSDIINYAYANRINLKNISPKSEIHDILSRPDKVLGYKIPLLKTTKANIINQSLPRINKLLGNDYTIAYNDVLDDMTLNLISSKHRKPENSFGGYFRDDNPNNIYLYNDTPGLSENYFTADHHEAMDAIINNLDEDSKTILYKIADDLFNNNNSVIFGSDVKESNLFKKQKELIDVINDKKSTSMKERIEARVKLRELNKSKEKGIKEILTTVSEGRSKLLEKHGIPSTTSVEDVNKFIDSLKDEDILMSFDDINDYSKNYVNQMRKNKGGDIKQIVNIIKKAYKVFPMAIPAVINNKNNKEQ